MQWINYKLEKLPLTKYYWQTSVADFAFKGPEAGKTFGALFKKSFFVMYKISSFNFRKIYTNI